MNRIFQPQVAIQPEYDDTTPACSLCGVTHVGVHAETALVLPGSFVFSAELGVSLFVLSPDARLSVHSLPNGQMAFIPDTEKGIAVSHMDCMQRLYEEIFDPEEDDDEDDTDDEIEIEDLY